MAKKRNSNNGKKIEFSGRFERLRQHFMKHPDSTLRTIFADVERMDGLHSFGKADKFIVECDEPEGLGGSDKAPTPTQLLLASLAHCQAITIRMYADAMSVKIDGLQVKATGTLDLRGYLSVDENGTKIDTALQEIVIRTEIVTHEIEAKIKEVLKAIKGKGVCLSTVEKGTKLRFQYRLNGLGIKI